MKKTSLFTAFILTSVVTGASADLIMGGCPKPFQGLQLRGILGYGVGAFKIESTKNGVNGVEGGIGTGYTIGCGNWRFGLLFDAIWANTKGSPAKMKNSLELYGKSGYVICDKVMPFLGLGWSNSRWSSPFVDSKRYDSLLWKAGIDFHMTKHVIAGFEYTGFVGERKRVDPFNLKVRPHDNRFAGTVTFIY